MFFSYVIEFETARRIVKFDKIVKYGNHIW